jgi:hypothetical protein
VRRLDLLCARVDNRIEAVRGKLAVAQRDPGQLIRLLCDRIETMTLIATLAEPLARKQASSLLMLAHPDLSGLIDILTNRVRAGDCLSDGAGGKRCARTLGSSHPRPFRTPWCRAAGSLAPAVAAADPARADRNHGPAAGSISIAACRFWAIRQIGGPMRLYLVSVY